ncbi:hypothetical protein EBS02_05400 [bacterium]|nr:hypothetical protein [bacterium]
MKIEVFLRHCYYSKIQEQPGKERPSWWNKEKVFQNFKDTLNPNTTNYTIIYDEFYGKIEDTFLSQEENVHIISAGGEAKSFLRTLEYILSKDFDDETIIYFLEDDYVHRPGWDVILQEGFKLPVSYVTLYDHKDKYTEMYADLLSKILITENSHWKPIPSTTNTFATKFKTLKEDKKIHYQYSFNVEPTADHQKFLDLNQKGKYLISCLPGYSTHCVNEWISPCINWSQYL